MCVCAHKDPQHPPPPPLKHQPLENIAIYSISLLPEIHFLHHFQAAVVLNKGEGESLGGGLTLPSCGCRGQGGGGGLGRAVAGSEEEFSGGNDLLCLPGGGGAVLLVKVRVSLEHDEGLGRVDADVLRQAAGVQKFFPAGITGVKDLGVGICFLHLLHRFGDLRFKCFGLIRRHRSCYGDHYRRKRR